MKKTDKKPDEAKSLQALIAGRGDLQRRAEELEQELANVNVALALHDAEDQFRRDFDFHDDVGLVDRIKRATEKNIEAKALIVEGAWSDDVSPPGT